MNTEIIRLSNHKGNALFFGELKGLFDEEENLATIMSSLKRGDKLIFFTNDENLIYIKNTIYKHIESFFPDTPTKELKEVMNKQIWTKTIPSFTDLQFNRVVESVQHISLGYVFRSEKDLKKITTSINNI